MAPADAPAASSVSEMRQPTRSYAPPRPVFVPSTATPFTQVSPARTTPLSCHISPQSGASAVSPKLPPRWKWRLEPSDWLSPSRKPPPFLLPITQKTVRISVRSDENAIMRSSPSTLDSAMRPKSSTGRPFSAFAVQTGSWCPGCCTAANVPPRRSAQFETTPASFVVSEAAAVASSHAESPRGGGAETSPTSTAPSATWISASASPQPRTAVPAPVFVNGPATEPNRTVFPSATDTVPETAPASVASAVNATVPSSTDTPPENAVPAPENTSVPAPRFTTPAAPPGASTTPGSKVIRRSAATSKTVSDCVSARALSASTRTRDPSAVAAPSTVTSGTPKPFVWPLYTFIQMSAPSRRTRCEA